MLLRRICFRLQDLACVKLTLWHFDKKSGIVWRHTTLQNFCHLHREPSIVLRQASTTTTFHNFIMKIVAPQFFTYLALSEIEENVATNKLLRLLRDDKWMTKTERRKTEIVKRNPNPTKTIVKNQCLFSVSFELILALPSQQKFFTLRH